MKCQMKKEKHNKREEYFDRLENEDMKKLDDYENKIKNQPKPHRKNN